MAEYLSFYFDKNDPQFVSKRTVVDDSSTNYIAHVFIKAPIYDIFGVQIGYKVSDDYIQQVAENEYVIRISSTYTIGRRGTISWQYTFINDKPSEFYPIGVLASSNIVSTTGSYFGKTGAVSLMPEAGGKRNVTVGFNF